jgi:hypothetical protein
MINKTKIIYFLVSIVVGLLLINVLLNTIKPKSIIKNDELSIVEIEQTFLNCIDEFGIDQSLITKNKLKKGQYDSLTYQYKIKIPSGVAIPVVLKDLNEMFINSSTSLTSSEKKVHGITSFTISSGGYTKLISEFKYQPELARQFSKIGFLITGFDEASDSELQTLFDIATPVGIILPLNEESQQTAELIKSKSYQYMIELNNDANFVDFNLDEDLELEKLNKNIKNIISSFNSPHVFFINKMESGFNASITNFISDEFQKRARKILTLNNYIYLKGENLSDLKSLINFHLNKMNYNNSKIFRISVEDWLSVQEELIGYTKKGNLIVSPTEIF